MELLTYRDWIVFILGLLSNIFYVLKKEEDKYGAKEEYFDHKEYFKRNKFEMFFKVVGSLSIFLVGEALFIWLLPDEFITSAMGEITSNAKSFIFGVLGSYLVGKLFDKLNPE